MDVLNSSIDKKYHANYVVSHTFLFFPTTFASAALRGEGVLSGDVSSLDEVAMSLELALEDMELADVGIQGCEVRSVVGDNKAATERDGCGGEDNFDCDKRGVVAEQPPFFERDDED